VKAPAKKVVKKKKDTRKPPPKLKGLDWKMTDSNVNEKENHWEWTAKGDWIAEPGDTTTYLYTFDSLWEGINADMIRKGMIEDENGTTYSISEFKRKYNKLTK